MKRLFPSLMIAFALSALVACSTLGLAPPKTFLDGAAAAQLTVTGVRQSALDLLNGGTISSAQAKTARAAADAGNQAIDLALVAYTAACPAVPSPVAGQPAAPDPNCAAPAATEKLDAAVAILKAAQTILLATGKAKP